MVITRYNLVHFLVSFWGGMSRKISWLQNCASTPNHNSRFKIQFVQNLSKIHNEKNYSRIQMIKAHLKIQN